ncbi:MAG: pyridoxal phosphate-dependent aminotransferase, partial [Syntrophomonadaceae bacterium]|nr:pyridoxal phosphate-dependent aminotransferase [Syntrophomonadaceae bacterium]
MYDFDKIIPRENTYSLKWDAAEKDVLPMWVADMDFQAPPEVIAALKERVEHGVFGYGGYGGWFEALAKWMGKRYGWRPELEWISTSPGVVAGLLMLVRALTEPGDKIVIQPPVYRPFYYIARSNGCDLVENPLYFDGHKYRMDLDQLKKVVDSQVKLLILCSPHNPVGRVWSREELAELGEFCLEHEIIIIADEIHSDLVLPGYKHTVLTSISTEMEEQMIVCNAPSKTFNIPGIHASNIIIPNERFRSAYQEVLRGSGLSLPNVFAVTAVEAAYTYGEAWLEELLRYIEGNYQLVATYLAERIPEVKMIEPEGTYLLWLDFRSLGLQDEELNVFIREKAKLLLESGTIFGTGGSGFQRMNIA